MRALAALPLVAALAGCSAGSANVEIDRIVVGDAICMDDGSAFATVTYSLWNGGPSVAQSIGTHYQVRLEPNEKYTPREGGQTIPALPVDSTRAYEEYVTIAKSGCPGAVGDEWKYFVVVRANPENGATSEALGLGTCVWQSFIYQEGVYCG